MRILLTIYERRRETVVRAMSNCRHRKTRRTWIEITAARRELSISCDFLLLCECVLFRRERMITNNNDNNSAIKIIIILYPMEIKELILFKLATINRHETVRVTGRGGDENSTRVYLFLRPSCADRRVQYYYNDNVATRQNRPWVADVPSTIKTRLSSASAGRRRQQVREPMISWRSSRGGWRSTALKAVAAERDNIVLSCRARTAVLYSDGRRYGTRRYGNVPPPRRNDGNVESPGGGRRRRWFVASGERVCAVRRARAMSALGERRQTTKIITTKWNLLFGERRTAAAAERVRRLSRVGRRATRRPGAASGGGGRPARGPSATEIAKTYRGPAPRRLRDMCANEKERGRRTSPGGRRTQRRRRQRVTHYTCIGCF